MQDYKKTLKRIAIYLAICVPIIAVVSFLLSYFFDIPLWLNVFVNVLLGIILCFAFYVFSDKLRKRREEQNKDKPKKFDPFAD